jgi:hypothetical protein
MKMLLVGVAALSVVLACRDPTGPTAAIQFRLDSATCVNLGTPNLGLQLLVDSVLRGRAVLSIGEVSQLFPVQPGTHTAFAREDFPGGYTWPTQRVIVPQDSSKLVSLPC